MDRRQRGIEQMLKELGFKFELLRQKKHFVYKLTLPDGRVKNAVFSKSASDWRVTMNNERWLRQLLDGEIA